MRVMLTSCKLNEAQDIPTTLVSAVVCKLFFYISHVVKLFMISYPREFLLPYVLFLVILNVYSLTITIFEFESLKKFSFQFFDRVK